MSQKESYNASASIQDGTIFLEDGTGIDLLKIQKVLNEAFQEFGHAKFADAANQLSEITGLVQGAHGEWLEKEDSATANLTQPSRLKNL